VVVKRRKGILISVFCSILVGVLSSPAWGARIKDIASFKGMRVNQLLGYGLVVGLNGTGDGSNTEFTVRSIANMLEKMGIHLERERVNQINVKNIAAVMVTAALPPFSRIGSRVDVLVSSLGDAKSLLGGTLLLTPLKGVDQQIYGLAQGPVVTGGFAVSGGSGTTVQKNHPTVGMISRGGTVEKEVPVVLDGKRELTLCLFNPDFTTAGKVKQAINRLLGGDHARCLDSATLQISIPESGRRNVAEWIASIESLEVSPDMVAKVILNEKTGTVVMGENVRLSTVAVAHGSLNIQIKESLNVSQPNEFSPPSPPGATPGVVPPGTGTIVVPGAATIVTPESSVNAKEAVQPLVVLSGGVSLGELVRALNAIGASPRDLISILQNIKAAGALQAELEIL
jgi:flagellar P-ring protein FlgI